VAADAVAAGNAITVAISQPLVMAYADNAVVTVRQLAASENLAFHANAFCLAMAPLSDAGHAVGAKIATAQDPKTNLTLRSRVWYEGSDAKLFVSIDALFGVKTLDGNLAVRMNRA
jgi:hypothetical protein